MGRFGVPRQGDELRNANLSGRGNNDPDCGSARSDSAGSWRRWDIPVSSARGDKKTARRDQRETAVVSITYHAAFSLTWHSHSTGVPLLSVPLAMSKLRPTWLAEATDRLQAADGLIARDSNEDEEEEDDEEEQEDTEDEYDGYSE